MSVNTYMPFVRAIKYTGDNRKDVEDFLKECGQKICMCYCTVRSKHHIHFSMTPEKLNSIRAVGADYYIVQVYGELKMVIAEDFERLHMGVLAHG